MKTTLYLVTINSNQRADALTVPELNALGQRMQAIGRYWTTPPRIFRVMRNLVTGAEPTAAQITGIVARGRIEIGAVQNRIHQHILITVTHNIDKPGLHFVGSEIKKRYLWGGNSPPPVPGLDNVYVNIRAFPNEEGLVAYIEKQQHIEYGRLDAAAILESVRSTVDPGTFADFSHAV